MKIPGFIDLGKSTLNARLKIQESNLRRPYLELNPEIKIDPMPELGLHGAQLNSAKTWAYADGENFSLRFNPSIEINKTNFSLAESAFHINGQLEFHVTIDLPYLGKSEVSGTLQVNSQFTYSDGQIQLQRDQNYFGIYNLNIKSDVQNIRNINIEVTDIPQLHGKKDGRGFALTISSESLFGLEDFKSRTWLPLKNLQPDSLNPVKILASLQTYEAKEFLVLLQNTQLETDLEWTHNGELAQIEAAEFQIGINSEENSLNFSAQADGIKVPGLLDLDRPKMNLRLSRHGNDLSVSQFEVKANQNDSEQGNLGKARTGLIRGALNFKQSDKQKIKINYDPKTGQGKVSGLDLKFTLGKIGGDLLTGLPFAAATLNGVLKDGFSFDLEAGKLIGAPSIVNDDPNVDALCLHRSSSSDDCETLVPNVDWKIADSDSPVVFRKGFIEAQGSAELCLDTAALNPNLDSKLCLDWDYSDIPLSLVGAAQLFENYAQRSWAALSPEERAASLAQIQKLNAPEIKTAKTESIPQELAIVSSPPLDTGKVLLGTIQNLFAHTLRDGWIKVQGVPLPVGMHLPLDIAKDHLDLRDVRGTLEVTPGTFVNISALAREGHVVQLKYEFVDTSGNPQEISSKLSNGDFSVLGFILVDAESGAEADSSITLHSPNPKIPEEQWYLRYIPSPKNTGLRIGDTTLAVPVLTPALVELIKNYFFSPLILTEYTGHSWAVTRTTEEKLGLKEGAWPRKISDIFGDEGLFGHLFDSDRRLAAFKASPWFAPGTENRDLVDRTLSCGANYYASLAEEKSAQAAGAWIVEKSLYQCIPLNANLSESERQACIDYEKTDNDCFMPPTPLFDFSQTREFAMVFKPEAKALRLPGLGSIEFTGAEEITLGYSNKANGDKLIYLKNFSSGPIKFKVPGPSGVGQVSIEMSGLAFEQMDVSFIDGYPQLDIKDLQWLSDQGPAYLRIQDARGNQLLEVQAASGRGLEKLSVSAKEGQMKLDIDGSFAVDQIKSDIPGLGRIVFNQARGEQLSIAYDVKTAAMRLSGKGLSTAAVRAEFDSQGQAPEVLTDFEGASFDLKGDTEITEFEFSTDGLGNLKPEELLAVFHSIQNASNLDQWRKAIQEVLGKDQTKISELLPIEVRDLQAILSELVSCRGIDIHGNIDSEHLRRVLLKVLPNTAVAMQVHVQIANCKMNIHELELLLEEVVAKKNIVWQPELIIGLSYDRAIKNFENCSDHKQPLFVADLKRIYQKYQKDLEINPIESSNRLLSIVQKIMGPDQNHVAYVSPQGNMQIKSHSGTTFDFDLPALGRLGFDLVREAQLDFNFDEQGPRVDMKVRESRLRANTNVISLDSHQPSYIRDMRLTFIDEVFSLAGDFAVHAAQGDPGKEIQVADFWLLPILKNILFQGRAELQWSVTEGIRVKSADENPIRFSADLDQSSSISHIDTSLKAKIEMQPWYAYFTTLISGSARVDFTLKNIDIAPDNRVRSFDLGPIKLDAIQASGYISVFFPLLQWIRSDEIHFGQDVDYNAQLCNPIMKGISQYVSPKEGAFLFLESLTLDEGQILEAKNLKLCLPGAPGQQFAVLDAKSMQVDARGDFSLDIRKWMARIASSERGGAVGIY